MRGASWCGRPCGVAAEELAAVVDAGRPPLADQLGDRLGIVGAGRPRLGLDLGVDQFGDLVLLRLLRLGFLRPLGRRFADLRPDWRLRHVVGGGLRQRRGLGFRRGLRLRRRRLGARRRRGGGGRLLGRAEIGRRFRRRWRRRRDFGPPGRLRAGLASFSPFIIWFISLSDTVSTGINSGLSSKRGAEAKPRRMRARRAPCRTLEAAQAQYDRLSSNAAPGY